MNRIVGFFIVVLAVFLSTACVRTPISSRQEALRLSSPTRLSESSFEGLAKAIRAQQAALLKRETLQFGPYIVASEKYLALLEKLAASIESGAPKEKIEDFIASNFEFLEVYGRDSWGEVLVTGYFEPLLSGSRSAKFPYTQPIYRKPPALLKLPVEEWGLVAPRELRARIAGNKVLPFYSRAEIDIAGALKGEGLEICYLQPIDAFFLQIQGSGRILLEENEEIIVSYADKNGAPYKALGAMIRDKLGDSEITMQTIENYLQGLDKNELAKTLALNPSYVFFEVSSVPRRTALGVSATPLRTIATDGKFFPKGALGLLQYQESDGSIAQHLVLDQDTGGAIVGPGRVDLFVGIGIEGKNKAGALKAPGKLWYLMPKMQDTARK